MQQIVCFSGYNDTDDLESIFSLDDEQGSHTLFMVNIVDSSSTFEASDSDSSSSTDDEQFMDYLTIQNFHSVQRSKIPLALVQIFIGKDIL